MNGLQSNLGNRENGEGRLLLTKRPGRAKPEDAQGNHCTCRKGERPDCQWGLDCLRASASPSIAGSPVDTEAPRLFVTIGQEEGDVVVRKAEIDDVNHRRISRRNWSGDAQSTQRLIALLAKNPLAHRPGLQGRVPSVRSQILSISQLIQAFVDKLWPLQHGGGGSRPGPPINHKKPPSQ